VDTASVRAAVVEADSPAAADRPVAEAGNREVAEAGIPEEPAVGRPARWEEAGIREVAVVAEAGSPAAAGNREAENSAVMAACPDGLAVYPVWWVACPAWWVEFPAL
jgi:hypothetical protein